MFRFMLKFVIVLCVAVSAITFLTVTQGESIPSWRIYYTTRLDTGYWVINEFEVDRRLTRRLFAEVSFHHSPTVSSNQRYAVNASGELFDRITGRRHLANLDLYYSFSPDSRFWLVYFDNSLQTIELLDDGTLGEPQNIIILDNLMMGTPFVWSPNSDMLAFETQVFENRVDELFRIYIYSFAENEIIEITQDATINTYAPTWSSDSLSLAYVGGDDTESHIYAINIDGTNQRQLTLSPVSLNSNTLTWSPDGRSIALITDGTFGQGLYVLATDGSGTMIGPIDRNWEASQITWSPDSTRILFRSARTSDLYVVHADGRFLHRLTNDDNTNFLLP